MDSFDSENLRSEVGPGLVVSSDCKRIILDFDCGNESNLRRGAECRKRFERRPHSPSGMSPGPRNIRLTMNHQWSSRQSARPPRGHDREAGWAKSRRAFCAKRLWLIVLLAHMATSAAARMAVAGPPAWTHFFIDSRLPGESWGTAGIPLADLDGDGDLDAALSRRDAQVFVWYERVTDAKWERHVVSENPDLQQGLGAAALDLNNDAWPDLVFSHVWFENPGSLRDHPEANWPTHPLAGGGHDILAADLNGDRREDVVIFDGESLAWFDSADSLQRHPVADNLGHHGGVTPHGAGDLDGDGDLDLVIAGAWWQNPNGRPSAWQRRPWPYRPIPGASYGTSIRSWVADVDADGRQDIVYCDCDTGSGHVHWVRNLGAGLQWSHRQPGVQDLE